MAPHGAHVLLVTLFSLLSTIYSQSGRCKTHDGASGECVNLPDCPPLLRIQQQIQANNAPAGSLDKLRASICEIKGGNIKVCCSSTQREQLPSATGEGVLPRKCGKMGLTDRIVNGQDATLLTWPWIALLKATAEGGRQSFVCGGVLISDRYVLTAAHCVHPSLGFHSYKVRLGEHTISGNPDCVGHVCAANYQEIPVAKEDIIIHEGYGKISGCSNCHDIALMRLSHQAEMNQVKLNFQKDIYNVQPICLPKNLQRDLGFSQFRSQHPWVAGWGIKEAGDNVISNVLQTVQLSINSDKCPFIHHDFHDKMLCADESGKGSCQGDSGGPMVLDNGNSNDITYYLIGIVAGGARICGSQDSGGRYTNVNSYYQWIISNLRG